jgi:PAS domain S-box-containing protein
MRQQVMLDEALPFAANLESRLEFETLISGLSSRLVNLPPLELDREIETALRRVCEFLDIELAVLWQWSVAAPDVIVPTHVYCAQGPPSTDPMRGEQYPWSRQQLLAGRVIAISSLDQLPAEAVVDRETCRIYGIKSALCLPLSLGGEPPIGGLGLNALSMERDWPDALVQRLLLVAQIFTSALARRRREQQLRDSERRLAAGAELAGLGFYEADFGDRTMFVDDRFRDIFGIPADRDHDLQALEFWMEHLHPDDRASILHLRERLHSGKVDQLSVEYRFLHPARGERWMQHLARVGRRDATGRAVKSYGVLRDVTESKHAEDELRDLSRRLIHAHEEERALLARELHDDVTQRLAVLAIDVGRAELVARGELQTEAMRSVRDGLVRLSEDVHSLAYQLHPSVLEELGLVEALRAECERRVRQGRLDLSVDLDPSIAAIDKNAALCLFRVAQEALSNVAAHAGARAASVTLRRIEGGLLLAVRDDGVGFDPANQEIGRSLGLLSMRERLRLVNGTLDIETAPGRGTAIIAWVPAEG